MQAIAEIKGIAFPNKGAEMLLVACLEQLKKHGFKTALEPYSPYEYKLPYPVFTKTRIHRFGVNILAPLSCLPVYARTRLGFVRPSEISLTLDASGFAYGTPWPDRIAKERLLGEKTNSPLILLPQSFGEFTTNAQQNLVKKIMSRARYAFAREQEGAYNIEMATGIKPKVVPDITFAVSTPRSPIERDIIIAPNFQVRKREGFQYVKNLIVTIEALLGSGRRVTILNHEGIKDAQICETICSAIRETGGVVEYINPATGIEAKSVIGSCKFVIASRYHALIAALSQGVPCIPLGWSYKYDAAMRLFDINYSDVSIVDAINSEKYINHFKSQKYETRLHEIKDELIDMWGIIFKGSDGRGVDK